MAAQNRQCSPVRRNAHAVIAHVGFYAIALVSVCFDIDQEDCGVEFPVITCSQPARRNALPVDRNVESRFDREFPCGLWCEVFAISALLITGDQMGIFKVGVFVQPVVPVSYGLASKAPGCWAF